MTVRGLRVWVYRSIEALSRQTILEPSYGSNVERWSRAKFIIYGPGSVDAVCFMLLRCHYLHAKWLQLLWKFIACHLHRRHSLFNCNFRAVVVWECECELSTLTEPNQSFEILISVSLALCTLAIYHIFGECVSLHSIAKQSLMVC